MQRIASIVGVVLAVWLGAATARAAPAPRIEVAFVMDATGSMGPYIEQARARIGQIAQSLAEGEPKPAVRFALVAFSARMSALTKVGVTRLDASGATAVPGTETLWLNPHGLERDGDRLYAASMGGGLMAFEPGPATRKRPTTKLGPLPSSDVTAVKTFAGALWIGTRAGLARLPQ